MTFWIIWLWYLMDYLNYLIVIKRNYLIWTICDYVWLFAVKKMLSTKKLNFLKYVSHLISAVQEIYSNADHSVAAPIEMVDLKMSTLARPGWTPFWQPKSTCACCSFVWAVLAGPVNCPLTKKLLNFLVYRYDDHNYL